jgi:single-strand DNA-binding protein
VAASLNSCNFIGNLGKDPEIRYASSGDCIANFSIACTEKWKDRASGELKESTEWIRMTAFGKLAEIVRDHVTKGMRVFCNGKFKTRKWQNQQGQDQYTTEIRLEQLIMLSGSEQSESGNDGGRPASRPSSQQRAPAGTRARPIDEMDDDQIPF